MNKNILCLILFICVFSCQKTHKPDEGNLPPDNSITYSVDSVSTQPGLIATLKASRLVTKDTCTVQLGGKPVILAKTDSLHYSFFVPVLAPGTYKLDLRTLDAGNSPDIVIRNYAAISDPDQVISMTMKHYNSWADSMAQNSLNNTMSPTDATFMHQLMDQLSQNLQSCTTEEKLLLAYQFQSVKLDDSSEKKTGIQRTYHTLGDDDQADPKEVSTLMTSYAIEGALKTAKAIVTIGATAAVINLAARVPSLFSLTAVVVAVATSYGRIKSAAEANEKAVSIAGVALGNVSEINPKDIVVSIGKSIKESLQTSFRTMRKSDETSSLNTYISNFIAVMSQVQGRDIAIKLSFDNIKSRFSNYFGQIKLNYTAYVSPVLERATETLDQIENKFITVTNVSNPDITVTTIDDGSNGLKLTFDNPSNTITTETSFAFTLTYTQEAINNKVSVTEQGKFIPLATPKVTTTVISDITQTTASSGGIITSDGGSPIVSKGIVYGPDANPVPDILNTIPAGTGTGSFASTITGLQAGKPYHLRAFAANNAGFGYGNDLTFTTLSVTTPQVTTNSASSITQTSALSGGNIINNGGDNISARGVCWATSPNPTVALPTKTNDGIAVGTFSSNITGLTENITYYVRAYGTNSAGTAYGNEINFTTAKHNDLNGTTWYGYYRCATWDADWGYVPMAFPIQVPKGYAPVTIKFSTGTDTKLDAVISYVWNGSASSTLSGSINPDHTQISWTSASSPWGDAVPVQWQIDANQMTGKFTPSGGGCITSFTFFKL